MRKLLLLAVVVVFAVPAVAATFTVTTNADAGAGSLRHAITLANVNAGADTIEFAIGSGAQTIQLASALPAITDSVTIDGTTQPGYSGTPLITVRGTGGGPGFVEAFNLQATATVRALALRNFNDGFVGSSNGNLISDNDIDLDLATGHGIFFTGSNNLIAGNDISVQLGSGVYLSGANNTLHDNTIDANRFGGVILATTATNNVIGGTASGQGNYIASTANTVVIEGSSNRLEGNELYFSDQPGVVYITGNNNTIGGGLPSARNVIYAGAGRTVPAINIAGNGNIVSGNYIALDPSGAAAGENALRITGDNNTFGGGGGSRNYIGGSIDLHDASSNTFQGNQIGANVSGTPLNGHIALRGASSDNTFTGNQLYGSITIEDSGTGNTILAGNAFYLPSEGIQLLPLKANDPGDADTGPNNYQNHPLITSSVDDPNGTTITGTLNSMPSTQFVLEFYTGSVCGESQSTDRMNVTTDASGNASFTFNTSVHMNVVTVTATDPAGNTSGMAPCVTTQVAATVSIADTTADESDGSAIFTITLSTAQSQPITVRFDVFPSSATESADYQKITTNVTFAPGEISKQVNVPIVQDQLEEFDESFFATIDPVSGNFMIFNATAVGTIVDDDIVLVSIGDTSVSEAGITAQVTVSLSAPHYDSFSMHYEVTGNTATAGQDFLAPSGGIVSFAPGETSTEIMVTILQDAALEGAESFFITLSHPSNDVVIADATAEVTILDDELVLISVTNARVAEGEANAEVTVLLSRPLETALTVDYNVAEGTASAGSDFIASNGTLTFAPGEISKTILLTTMSDRETEPDETILVTLSNPSHGTIANGTATITLTDVEIPGRRRAVRK